MHAPTQRDTGTHPWTGAEQPQPSGVRLFFAFSFFWGGGCTPEGKPPPAAALPARRFATACSRGGTAFALLCPHPFTLKTCPCPTALQSKTLTGTGEHLGLRARPWDPGELGGVPCPRRRLRLTLSRALRARGSLSSSYECHCHDASATVASDRPQVETTCHTGNGATGERQTRVNTASLLSFGVDGVCPFSQVPNSIEDGCCKRKHIFFVYMKMAVAQGSMFFFHIIRN
ncbi:uncharacterized protein LOC128143025 [Harpia harpyja]|uniref:uncharacterized protein LOC128143025 n=1 Tax=Harpia harpyja TaxID=202280 RepID=UPI0022B1BDAB|nr:uncharacterized protein LOC128143025 [Harpia harpyja]